MSDTNKKFSFLDYSGLSLFWSKIKKIIEDNELVVATAITDLDKRIEDNKLVTTATITDLDKKIEVNELVTTAAISNLDKRIDDIQGNINPIVSVTYLELVNLRDKRKLIPGQQYRITDYITTTTQENTQSAGHPFDVIVTADDVNVLNEVARACLHDGDTYFSNSDLNAWELKYCLDNDTNRFEWAGTNSKGIIYYMKDEWDNECPYDFKNIQFARWELSNPVGYINDGANNWVEGSTAFDSLKTGFYGVDGTKKVFYYGYDKYHRYKVEYTISASPTYCYTFGKDTDYSINGSNYGNVIKEYKSNNKLKLNNIVFLSNYCYSNSFGNGCIKNSFGNECSINSFGNGCHENSFCYSCYGNSFGNDCYYNSFGNVCVKNIFGNGCYSNSFETSCDENSLGNGSYYNSFGTECRNNSFGNNCYSNSFGYGCSSNSFGNDCSRNSFGNNFNSNSFGNECYSNNFGNDCNSNSFGNDCDHNNFGESYDNLKAYYRYIIFDDGNRYINLNCTSTTSSANYYQNVRIGLGVNNTYSYKTINDSNVGQTYETCYKPANSQTITV